MLQDDHLISVGMVI